MPNVYFHTNSKGITYFLHKTDVTLRGGKKTTIYFFRKSLNRESGIGEQKPYWPCELPAEKLVRENPRNGFLTVTTYARNRG